MSEAGQKQEAKRGFRRGWLVPVIVGAVIVAGLIGYAGYYAVSAYKRDPAFQTVFADVQQSATARGKLGDNIQLSGFPSYSFSYSTDTGHTATYRFGVKGSKGEGSVQSDLVYVNEKPIIRSLVLTAPNGLQYDLLTTKGSSSRGIRYLARPSAAKPIAI